MELPLICKTYGDLRWIQMFRRSNGMGAHCPLPDLGSTHLVFQLLLPVFSHRIDVDVVMQMPTGLCPKRLGRRLSAHACSTIVELGPFPAQS